MGADRGDNTGIWCGGAPYWQEDPAKSGGLVCSNEMPHRLSPTGFQLVDVGPIGPYRAVGALVHEER